MEGGAPMTRLGIPANCNTQTTTGFIDLRLEASLWLLMSSDELKRKLQVERQRGLDGHWGYDVNRHRAMLSAYRIILEAEKEGTR